MGKQNNGVEFKANTLTTNANTTSISRQEEGARIINMCFANAEEAVAA
jgi:hypothetical protein